MMFVMVAILVLITVMVIATAIHLAACLLFQVGATVHDMENHALLVSAADHMGAWAFTVNSHIFTGVSF